MNKILLLFDIICLPITLLRLLIIYMNGAKYNVPNASFLDVMMHATNPYFNMEGEMTVDVLNNDIRCVIYDNSKLTKINAQSIEEEKEDMKYITTEHKDTKNISTVVNDSPIENKENDQIDEIKDRMGVDLFGKIDDYKTDNKYLFGKRDDFSLSDNLMTEIESDTDVDVDIDAEMSPDSETDSDDIKRAQNENSKILTNNNLSDIDGMINKVWNELNFESD